MDTKEHVHFWIERVAKTADGSCSVLQGYDFAGGLATAGRAIGSGPLWLVTESGAEAFAGKVALVHRQRVGYDLHLLSGLVSPCPCFLTTAPDIRLVYHGPVSLTAELPMSLDEAVGQGLALRGENWLGVVRGTNHNDYEMYIYGSSSLTHRIEFEGHCPEWSDGTDEVEGRFRVSILQSSSFGRK